MIHPLILITASILPWVMLAHAVQTGNTWYMAISAVAAHFVVLQVGYYIGRMTEYYRAKNEITRIINRMSDRSNRND